MGAFFNAMFHADGEGRTDTILFQGSPADLFKIVR